MCIGSLVIVHAFVYHLEKVTTIPQINLKDLDVSYYKINQTHTHTWIR